MVDFLSTTGPKIEGLPWKTWDLTRKNCDLIGGNEDLPGNKWRHQQAKRQQMGTYSAKVEVRRTGDATHQKNKQHGILADKYMDLTSENSNLQKNR
jgi:hypothetical protein